MFNKSKLVGPVSRRSFLLKGVALTIVTAASGLIQSCFEKKSIKVIGKIMGGNAEVGHLLRKGNLTHEPSEIIKAEYIIVGGGVAGLSAARHLKKQGINSFHLLEMDERVGGNSVSGINEISAYPWGAHYLPLPNSDNEDLVEFLRECEVITGIDHSGKPVFNEYYLCFAPHERLFINGYWQEGLIPNFGVPENDSKEIEDFLSLMTDYRSMKGSDGKDAFTIPLDYSSQDENLLQLDKLSMKEFLTSKGLNSPYLQWYVSYCCRDDFGTSIEETSAWAGIHYFAARKAQASNAESSTVLTWPEGNGWLTDQLKADIKNNILANCLAISVYENEEGLNVDYLEVKTGSFKRIVAPKCILATPQFVTKRIVKGIDGRSYEAFTYAPWMVANITLKNLPDKNGKPLSWDNVFYQSKSLGYINANHQHLNQYENKRVFTYYLALSDKDPVEARKEAISRKHEEWTTMIIEDLSRAHKGIEKEIENLDVWLWGHGMIRPLPGFIWGRARAEAGKAYNNKIFFAHSDLSGISIFEEAFYQGIKAAKEALK